MIPFKRKSFTWDKNKDLRNQAKHNVSFDLAQEVFDAPFVRLSDTRHNYGEERFIAIGRIKEGAFLTVVYTLRKKDIRIISARPAHRKERAIYEQEKRKNG